MKYDISSIKQVEGIQAIRLRPTMYIDSVGILGNTHLFKETISNSIDEYLMGFGNEIIVSYNSDINELTVIDNGRGIPYDPVDGFTKIVTKTHTSGKFEEGAYSSSAGLNGVGLTAVNALSSKFSISSHRDNALHIQHFEKGKPTSKLLKSNEKSNHTGTIIKFIPDEEIMDTKEFDIELIKEYMYMQSFINSNLKLIFIDEKKNKKDIYFHKDGLTDFIKNKMKHPLYPEIYNNSFTKSYTNDKGRIIKMEVAISFSYDKNLEENIASFANTVYTKEGGTHETGLKLAMVNAVNSVIADNPLLVAKEFKSIELTGDDIRSGLTAIISIKHNDVLYQGQTKTKLSNTDITGFINSDIKRDIIDYLNSNKKIAKIIIENAYLNAKARNAAKRAKENIIKKGDSNLTIISDLAKLADCISKDNTKNEIYIVEGNSAAGTAVCARDKETMAIYSLRGKILNTNDSIQSKIFNNKELSDLIYILTGLKHGINDNINNIKYGKVIIMTDADDDGKIY